MLQVISWSAWAVWFVTWVIINFRNGKCFWGSFGLSVIAAIIVATVSIVHCHNR